MKATALALTLMAAPAAPLHASGRGVATTDPEPLDSIWALVDASAATTDQDRKKEILREAEGLAREILVGHEHDIERRHALAVVLGLRTNVEGGRTKVRIASALSSEVQAILAVEPDHAGARHMLGRLHAGVRRMNGVLRWVATNLLGGDELDEATWEAAEQHLAFAERAEPSVADHHLQLALLYRDTGRPGAALEELEHVMRMQAGTALELAVHREAMQVWTRLQP
jgi:hypothetical protein